jgi:hypothetical protein
VCVRNSIKEPDRNNGLGGRKLPVVFGVVTEKMMIKNLHM